MRIKFYPSPSGSAYWRLFDPAKYIRKLGVDISVAQHGINQEEVESADIHILQNCVDRDGIALLYEYQQEHGKKIVVDADDYFKLNPENPHSIEHDIQNASEVLKVTLEIADMVTVTTDYLADKLREVNKNVVVLPNFMDLQRWDIEPKLRNTADTIRIGFAGSFTHIKDLEILVNPFKRIYAEFPQCRFIFVGDTRVKELFEGLPVEAMLGVAFDVWPTRLNGLRLDIGVAPLQKNEFNLCKSNIKFLEYSINQIPGVYSDTVYKFRDFNNRKNTDAMLGLIATNEEEWYRCLKNLIISPPLREDIAQTACSYVRTHFNLETHASEWVKAYKSLT